MKDIYTENRDQIFFCFRNKIISTESIIGFSFIDFSNNLTAHYLYADTGIEYDCLGIHTVPVIDNIRGYFSAKKSS